MPESTPGRHLLRRPDLLLALGFGSGLAPKAPGTFGTLVAIPLFLLLAPLPLPAYGAIVAALFGAGVWLCGRAGRELGVSDHPAIVWDEIVGYLVTMFAAPAGWLSIVAGFALFRLFDITKPWPIRWLDRQLHGGFGTMVDDLAAGIAAAVCLQVILYLL